MKKSLAVAALLLGGALRAEVYDLGGLRWRSIGPNRGGRSLAVRAARRARWSISAPEKGSCAAASCSATASISNLRPLLAEDPVPRRRRGLVASIRAIRGCCSRVPGRRGGSPGRFQAAVPAAACSHPPTAAGPRDTLNFPIKVNNQLAFLLEAMKQRTTIPPLRDRFPAPPGRCAAS